MWLIITHQKPAPNALWVWVPTASRYKHFSVAWQTFHTTWEQLRPSLPMLQLPQSTPSSPMCSVSTIRGPLSLPWASPQTHLNSFTFKLGATLFSPVQLYLTSLGKITYIPLCVFLTLSVCIPIILSRLTALGAEIHLLSSYVPGALPIKTLENMPDDVNRENNSEVWIEASNIQLVILYQGLHTFL